MRFLTTLLLQRLPSLLSSPTGALRAGCISVLLLGLSACESESTGSVITAPDKVSRIQLAPPQELVLTKAVDLDSLQLNVKVDGEEVDMTLNPVTGLRSGTIRLKAGTNSQIEIIWGELYLGKTLELGKAARSVEVTLNATKTQEVRFLRSDFDFSADTDDDKISNLQERGENTDPLDASSPGVPPVQVPVVVRFQVPDERVLQNADILQNLTPIATFNGDLLQLNRAGNTWVGETTATQNSNGFVSVDVYQNPDQRLQLAMAKRNQPIGDGAEFNFATDSYESNEFDDDKDELSNLEEIIQGFEPLDSNSPLKNPCDTSQFAVGCTIDSDNDGVADSLETAVADTDGDGVKNYLESANKDDDEDGRNAERDVNDGDACIPSTNNVACQNILKDTDGDNKTDVQEGTGDSDGDGIPDFRESSLSDADGDDEKDEADPANTDPCIPRASAQACLVAQEDFDGDGKTDIAETTTRDSDGDGIPDYQESSINDQDMDNRVDEADIDNSNPCIPNTTNTACADQERDTDGDGESDLSEGLTADADSDSIPDFEESSILDADNDGTVNELDPANNDACVPSTTNAACVAQLQDSDSDNKTDLIETLTANADGDMFPDYLDSAILDTDLDGVFDEQDSSNSDPCIPATNNTACQTALDGDGDGAPDAMDNCPTVPNPLQTNSDTDMQGDACDTDDDNDGVLDASPDNCPTTANPGQLDSDMDGMGDACDLDSDNDTILDNAPDNCPTIANVTQADNDLDNLGDLCDPDDDNDTIPDAAPDNCPFDANTPQTDTDGDGIGDVCDTLTDSDGDGIADAAPDNCPAVANTPQTDTDGDGMGDACDVDDDDDTILDNLPDNCPLTANLDQLDSDADGMGDVCDPDDDNDTILDLAPDNCPLMVNLDQLDTDADGMGDVCDLDDDNDTILDLAPDNCPLDANTMQIDSDGDLIGDVCDPMP